METLENIFLKYNTDKNANCHNYSRQYENLLKPYREKNIKYLEIGIYQGESLKAMREVFSNADIIVGVDINESCKVYEDISKNIYVEIGDATNDEVINRIIKKYGTFDIILDDGSHINRDVIKSFEKLFPLLNDNGLYIVEDTVCYNYGNFIDTNYESHLEYFYKYIPFLNQTSGFWCVDPYKINKKTNNVFEYSIDKIEFGCSYIGIHKKIRHNWIP